MNQEQAKCPSCGIWDSLESNGVCQPCNNEKKSKRLWAVLAAIGVTIPLLVIYFSVFFVDFMCAFSLHWWFIASVIFLAVLFACCVRLWRKCYPVSVPLFFFVLGMLIMPFWDHSPTKPFHRFYRVVKQGMTEEEVQSKLVHYFPDGGKFPRPVKNLYGVPEDGIVFILDPYDPSYNAELVCIYLKDGVVVSKEYLPD